MLVFTMSYSLFTPGYRAPHTLGAQENQALLLLLLPPLLHIPSSLTGSRLFLADTAGTIRAYNEHAPRNKRTEM